MPAVHTSLNVILNELFLLTVVTVHDASSWIRGTHGSFFGSHRKVDSALFSLLEAKAFGLDLPIDSLLRLDLAFFRCIRQAEMLALRLCGPTNDAIQVCHSDGKGDERDKGYGEVRVRPECGGEECECGITIERWSDKNVEQECATCSTEDGKGVVCVGDGSKLMR